MLTKSPVRKRFGSLCVILAFIFSLQFGLVASTSAQLTPAGNTNTNASPSPTPAPNTGTNTASAGRRGFGLIDPLGNISLQTIIARIIQYALGFVGALLLAMFIYGGFIWATAGGDAKRVEEAKATIRNAVIGLVVVGLSYTLINLLFGLASTVLEG